MQCNLGRKMIFTLTLVQDGQHDGVPPLFTLLLCEGTVLSGHQAFTQNCYLCLICSSFVLHLTKNYLSGHFFKDVCSPARMRYFKQMMISCLAQGVFQVHSH